MPSFNHKFNHEILKQEIIKIFNFFFGFFVSLNLYADNHNIYETLEKIQSDIKTLEKAVYSQSSNLKFKFRPI